MRSRSAAWLVGIGILALTFAAYLPSLDNGFTNWDDPLFVLRNPLLSHPSLHAILTTPVANNIHPLTIASLILNYRLSGLNPISYHLLNLLLHLANTALVFLFIRSLMRGRLWAAAFTSLLFGIHPMHVESVAWIAERKDVLYAFFYLWALLAYVRYLDRVRATWLGAAFLAFVLSVLSKPSAVVLPLTLFALDAYRRRPVRPVLFLEKIPFAAVSLWAGLLTIRTQEATGAVDTASWGPSFDKVLYASFGVVMYVVKLFVPVRLSAVYPYPVGGPGPEHVAAFVGLLVGLPLLFILFRRHREVLFGVIFFFINIALVLQIFTVGGAIMADRYTYIPYIGLLLAVTWWLDASAAEASGRSRVFGGGAFASVLAAVFMLLVPVSFVQTWIRCDVWRDSESLWNDTIQRYPGRIVDAYYNRGYFYYRDQRRYDAALLDFDRALSIDPRAAKVWIVKGNVLADRNEIHSALLCFHRALSIDPRLEDAWNNRGLMKLRERDAEGALADFTHALAIDPRSRHAFVNRALTYGMLGQFERSIADSRNAIAADPDHPENDAEHGSIGVAMVELGRHRDAIPELDRAIQHAPKAEPRLGAWHLYRSRARWALGDRTGARDDALEAQRQGARLDPDTMRRFEIPPASPR